MRKFLKTVALVAASLFSIPALAANSWGTDLSDLWWNPEESGWGVNIAHQGEVMFMTLFVYGSDDKVRWYVGPAITSGGGADAFSFRGPIYETTGPFLGNTFTPDDVSLRPVGSATITFPNATAGLLTFDVDGARKEAWMQRQTFRTNNLSGAYSGGTIASTSFCTGSSGSVDVGTQFVVSHSGQNIVISAASGNAGSCTYSGFYSQYGRMGIMEGTVSCSNGRRGLFQAFEAEAGYMGFSTRFSTEFDDGCTETGRFGGIKRN